ncbi:hypothetical protein JW921_11000 [Candidatus Fermentibacterales bacterium]|nr:hypothetical protein [Candidatus Fermentibacterales bacterium]
MAERGDRGAAGPVPAGLADLLAFWQDMLRLRDWDIRTETVTGRWRKSGDIKIDTSNRMAILMISSEVRPEHLEELVVHELLHLKLYGLDQMIEELIACFYGPDESDSKRKFARSTFMEILESTTEDLTKACLGASGWDGELSFRRVEREVRQELGEAEEG